MSYVCGVGTFTTLHKTPCCIGPGYAELRRIHLPRTPVNRGRRERRDCRAPALPVGLGTLLDSTLLDLGYLVGHQTMRRAVYSLGRFLVRGVRQAEDLARLFVEPVLEVLDPVLVLGLLVLPVGVCDSLSGQAFHAPVMVHE